MPQISVICGASAGGGSYSPALTDFVVMTKRASMFLTGPGVVKEVMGEDIDATTLGGPKVHERNGVCQLVADGDLDAAWLVRDLLDYLPQHAAELPRRWPSAEEYERDWLSCETAAREGAIDEIVAPAGTRRRLCKALGMLMTAAPNRERAVMRNIPL